MIGCFDRPFLLAGALIACVAFEWKPVLRNVFCLRNFIAFIVFLAHFSYAINCVACVAFGWKPGFRPTCSVVQHNVTIHTKGMKEHMRQFWSQDNIV